MRYIKWSFNNKKLYCHFCHWDTLNSGIGLILIYFLIRVLSSNMVKRIGFNNLLSKDTRGKNSNQHLSRVSIQLIWRSRPNKCLLSNLFHRALSAPRKNLKNLYYGWVVLSNLVSPICCISPCFSFTPRSVFVNLYVDDGITAFSTNCNKVFLNPYCGYCSVYIRLSNRSVRTSECWSCDPLIEGGLELEIFPSNELY